MQTLVGMMDDGSGCLMYSTEKQSCAAAVACVDFCKRQWFRSKPQLSVVCVCVCFCNSFTFIRDKYISLVLLHTNCIYIVQKRMLAITVSSMFYATFLSQDLIMTFIHHVGLEINMDTFFVLFFGYTFL